MHFLILGTLIIYIYSINIYRYIYVERNMMMIYIKIIANILKIICHELLQRNINNEMFYLFQIDIKHSFVFITVKIYLSAAESVIIATING